MFRRAFPKGACEAAINWLNSASTKADTTPSLEAEFEMNTPEGPRSVRKLRRLLWNDMPFWSEVLEQSKILELGAAFIEESPTVVFHAAFLKPRLIGSEVAFHQDQALWNYDYPDAISMWIALTDSQKHNGCLQLFPHSHLRGLIPHREDASYPLHPCLSPDVDGLTQPEKLPMHAGDVVVWHRYMVHGSDANLSNDDRKGMVIVFVNGARPDFKARDIFRVPMA
jgi:ectoine hydroxylase-related dioxygenase (phytanoyl-CoA dioxygenase family)